MYLTARRLAIHTGLFSRRQLKRLRERVKHREGAPLAWDDEVEITREPQEFSLAGWTFRAQLARPCLIALNKPLGVVTSRRADGGHLPVFSLLNGHELPRGLEAVGRLDQDTRGLLLFTMDGTLLHRLTHPRWAVPRSYLAATEDPLAEAEQAQLMAGQVELRDGHKPLPQELMSLEHGSLLHGLLEPGPGHAAYEITLSSGRYHEVRRIFAACGTRVSRLFRHRYGPVDLRAEHLAPLREPEAVMRLTGADLEAVYAAVSLPVPDDQIETVVLS